MKDLELEIEEEKEREALKELVREISVVNTSLTDSTTKKLLKLQGEKEKEELPSLLIQAQDIKKVKSPSIKNKSIPTTPPQSLNEQRDERKRVAELLMNIDVSHLKELAEKKVNVENDLEKEQLIKDYQDEISELKKRITKAGLTLMDDILEPNKKEKESQKEKKEREHLAYLLLTQSAILSPLKPNNKIKKAQWQLDREIQMKKREAEDIMMKLKTKKEKELLMKAREKEDEFNKEQKRLEEEKVYQERLDLLKSGAMGLLSGVSWLAKKAGQAVVGTAKILLEPKKTSIKKISYKKPDVLVVKEDIPTIKDVLVIKEDIGKRVPQAIQRLSPGHKGQKAHEKIIHLDTFKCNICGRRFETNVGLNRHMSKPAKTDLAHWK